MSKNKTFSIIKLFFGKYEFNKTINQVVNEIIKNNEILNFQELSKVKKTTPKGGFFSC